MLSENAVDEVQILAIELTVALNVGEQFIIVSFIADVVDGMVGNIVDDMLDHVLVVGECMATNNVMQDVLIEQHCLVFEHGVHGLALMLLVGDVSGQIVQ